MPRCAIYNKVGDQLVEFRTEDLGSRIYIGRSTECNVCLRGAVDATVSRKQLLLSRSGGTWHIQNIGHAPMYINAVKETDTELGDGDVVRFSDLFLTFGDSTRPSGYILSWDVETEDDATHAILWPGANSVGASRDNYVTVRREEISRRHAMILIDNNGVHVKSIAPNNQTKLNGMSLSDVYVNLSPGDLLTLGGIQVNLEMETSNIQTVEDALAPTEENAGLKSFRRRSERRLQQAIRRRYTLFVTLFLLLIVVIILAHKFVF